MVQCSLQVLTFDLIRIISILMKDGFAKAAFVSQYYTKGCHSLKFEIPGQAAKYMFK